MKKKATELYKVDLNVLITEAEKLLSSGSCRRRMNFM